MINKKFFASLKEGYVKSEGERRQIISLSNLVLNDSKRIIFALHRGDFEKAEEMLLETEKKLASLEKKFSHARVAQEGSYKASVEEYVEAKMLYFVLKSKRVDKILGFKIDTDSYLGGISDLTGEMVRQAVNSAAKGKFDEVEKMKNGINDILAELVEFDMTGYQRTKYDQARTNLRKIEQISYEVALSRRKNEK
jgi:predicted translin family RNA/ssDNA-binding protein